MRQLASVCSVDLMGDGKMLVIGGQAEMEEACSLNSEKWYGTLICTLNCEKND